VGALHDQYESTPDKSIAHNAGAITAKAEQHRAEAVGNFEMTETRCRRTVFTHGIQNEIS
jgi:hypothetical protein